MLNNRITKGTRSQLLLEILEDRSVPATFVVDNPLDQVVAGSNNLRQQITAANAAANVGGNDLILIANNITLIELQSALPPITEGVDIEPATPVPQILGTGEAPPPQPPLQMVTIKRVNEELNYRIFTIDMAAEQTKYAVKLTRLIMTNGFASGTSGAGDGGAIWSRNAELGLKNSQVIGNHADNDGGGIWILDARSKTATTEIIGEPFNGGAAITSNYAGNDGGGIYVHNSYLGLHRSSVKENYALRNGGGVAGYATDYAHRQLIEIDNASVSANTAQLGSGGGIYMECYSGNLGPVLVLKSGHIDDNKAIGLKQNGQLISGGLGGGVAFVANCVLDTGFMAINGMTISNNAQSAAAIAPSVVGFHFSVFATVNLVGLIMNGNWIYP